MQQSQTSQILEALKNGEILTPIDALNRFSCFRLGARVYELRHGKYDGTFYRIDDIPHQGKQYSAYKLSRPEQVKLI